jgi:hypothetical protein
MPNSESPLVTSFKPKERQKCSHFILHDIHLNKNGIVFENRLPHTISGPEFGTSSVNPTSQVRKSAAVVLIAGCRDIRGLNRIRFI